MSLARDTVQATLRGAGQVFFVASPLAGALFIAAVAVASIEQAVGAVVGLLAATVVGRAMGASSLASWASGLHGYNGLLVGTAMVAFRGLSPGVLAAIVVGAALTAATLDAATRVGRTVGAAPLTAPFLIVTCALLAACRSVGIGEAAVAGPAVDVDAVSAALALGTVRGLGQVFLQGELLSAALVLLGLLAASWRLAAWAVLGSFVGAATGVALGRALSEVAGGLLGYDAALCAVGVVVLVGLPGLRGVVLSIVVSSVGAATAVLLTAPMSALGLPRLTSAFVVVTIVVLVVRHAVGRFGVRAGASDAAGG